MRQRVIVVSPFGRHQVDLPADLPVSGFLPDLLAGVGLYPREGASAAPAWQLQASDGQVLAPGDTLRTRGIPPGAVLWLRGGGKLGTRSAAPTPADTRPAASKPGVIRSAAPTPADTRRTPSRPAPTRPAITKPAASAATAPRAAGTSPAATGPTGAGPVAYPPPAARSGRAASAPPGGPPTRAAPPNRAARWPSRTPLPAAPLAADDGLTPLERTEAVLPSPVPRARRLMAAAETLLQRPQPADPGVIAVGPGIEQPGPPPAQTGPGSGAVGGPATQDAAEPAGPLHLIPTDLTVAAAPTRAERVRAVWRDLDHLGQLDARIARPRLRRCATIAVVSPKGGVGKTTVVALLGTLFALLRRDPVVAVDTNPDFGSLGRVLAPDQSWYVDDLARLVAEEDGLSLTALESRLGRAVHGLLVVPALTDPVRMAALDERAYRQVITRLKDFFSVILLDCGTGFQIRHQPRRSPRPTTWCSSPTRSPPRPASWRSQRGCCFIRAGRCRWWSTGCRCGERGSI